MKQTADYITEEKRKALEIELKELKGPKRKEILESLAYAKSLGDLSEDGEKREKKYQIVGSEEADMAQGKISNKSPFGQALLGRKKGDDISFKTPSGAVNYKIINVS